MRSIQQYIQEAKHSFRIKSHLKKIKYTPKTRGELIEVIKTELDNDNTDLNCIDTSEITDMKSLFDQHFGIELTDKQQKTLDVSEWVVSNVKNMNHMFYGCEQFNSDLSNWDVSNVENMEYIFTDCERFNSDISKWNVSKVKYMRNMFALCKNFNSDLSKWDVSNVENMNNMFYGSRLEGNEPSWYKK